MSDHTPGPWNLSSGWRPIVSVVDTRNVYGAAPAGVVAHVVMASQDGVYSAEKKANASLIAAAPEMLEALRGIDDFAWSAVTADCEESRVELMRRITVARAAILKAIEPTAMPAGTPAGRQP